MSDYLRYVLGADNSSSEFAQLQGLVADAGPDIPGGDGANEGFWRQQLRDRLGQFAKMFGLVLFDIEVEGIGRLTGHGELVDIVRPGVGVVRIKNHPILPDSDIEMLGEQLEAIDALIPDADFERVTGKTLPKNKASELKDEITGDEALQKIYGQMGLHAKKSGRFAVGRSVKDVRAAAKETYKAVYDKLKVEYPELMTDFPDYESYWDYASNSLAAGTFTRWADSVDDIPELTKASNKIYAREVLGLKEDGLIEFYRNSINHKSSPELAGAGYASLDRRMAWDYNSYLIKYEDNGLNETDGRYVVKAKPDEVTGLLGISGAEDEYGVVIGLDVTSQPGRTTRVGDLEMQQVSPWSNDIKTFDRSGGGSPFRRVSPASQFEVFATENPLPGNGYGDFYEAFGLDKESRPIPTKWDEMFGEGSFDALNGDYPGYRSMQSLFVDAGDGKVGLDMMELDQISSRDSQNPEANDTYDKTLKMLSVIQELSGKTFMVHRGHNPEDPRIPEEPDSVANDVPTPETSSEKSKPLLDFSNFEKVSGPLGSNPGGVYKDPATGKQYYVKIQDKKRGDNEQLASALYREAGLDALEVKSGTLNGDNITYTDWRDEKLESVSGKISGSEPLSPDDPAFDGFAIDAWLANWDVVGTGYDNLSFDKDGNPVRLDSGGSLLYRARGDRKGDAFGEEVGELETFKNQSNTTGQLFQDMGTDAEAKSVKKLEAITPERIDELVDQFVSDPDDNKELKDKLKARREFILSKYDQEESSSEKEEPDDTPLTPQVFTNEQEVVIKNYSSYGYRDTNTYLRLGRQGAIEEFATGNAGDRADRAEKSIEEINKVFETSALERDATLFRLVPRDIAEGVKVGDILSDSAILSTTKNPESDDINKQFNATIFGGLERYYEDKYDGAHPNDVGWAIFEIEAPAGTKAIDIASISEFPAEREVLLPSNASLEVVSVEEIEGIKNRYKRPGDIFKAYKVKVRVVPASPAFEPGKRITSSDGSSEEFWNTDKTPGELKSEVAAETAQIMLDNGISVKQLDALNQKLVSMYDTGTNDPYVSEWEGSAPYGQIMVTEGAFGFVPLARALVRFSSTAAELKSMSSTGDFNLTMDDVKKILEKANSSEDALSEFRLYQELTDSERAKMAVSTLITDWASSSNGNNPRSLALQEIAEIVFDTKNARDWKSPPKTKAEIEKIKQEYGGMLSAFLQAQYEQTQKRFKEAGITEVVLYRGIDDVALGKTLSDDKLTGVDVQSRPLSSWSTSDGTAYWFATGGSDSEASGEDVFDPESDHRGAVLLRRVVPVDQILSSSFTGVGSYDEQEMVIIGGEMKAEAVGAVKENKLIQVMREREGSTWNPLTGLETSAEKQERIEPGFENWNKEVEKIFEDWDNDLIAGVEIYDAGNILQANFIKKAGFNEKPKVLSQEEFDAIEAETVYRGHQSIAFMNNYIDSELQFASEGYFGNGTYTSNKRETAEAYAGGSGPDPLTQAEIDEHILEMKLLPDANVISFGSSPALREWAEEKTTEFLEGYEKSGANPAQYQEAEWRLFNEADYTNIAIMLGIDAIRFKFPLTDAEEYYTIIFNRGKVAINGKS